MYQNCVGTVSGAKFLLTPNVGCQERVKLLSLALGPGRKS